MFVAQRRSRRPEQECRLPDRPRRLASSVCSSSSRDGLVGQKLNDQPDRDPGAPARGPVVPPRSVRGQRWAGVPSTTTSGDVRGVVLRRQCLFTRPGHQQREPLDRPARSRREPDGPDARPAGRGLTASNTDYLSPRLLGVHRLRHSRRAGGIPPPGLQRRAGAQRRAARSTAAVPDRSPRPTHRHDASTDRAPGRHHAVPPVRGHRVRPVRLLLARLYPHRFDHRHHHRRQHGAPSTATISRSAAAVRRQPVRRRPGDADSQQQVTPPMATPASRYDADRRSRSRAPGRSACRTMRHRNTPPRSSPTATRPAARQHRRPDPPDPAQRRGHRLRRELQHLAAPGFDQLHRIRA